MLKRTKRLTLSLGLGGLAVLAIAMPREALAATTITGGNIVNQTWTMAGSPYIIQGDITVPVGSTLTIQAGVEVQVGTSDGLGTGRDLNEVEVTIRGTLISQGTAASPVTFRSLSAGAGQWYGIVIDNAGAMLTTNNMVVQNATYGFLVSDSTPTLNGLTATGNAYGVYYERAGGGTISNSVFRGNTVAGVYMYTTNSSMATVTINQSTLHGNTSYGVYAESATGSSAAMNITNSILTQQQYGVARYTSLGNTTVSVTYSDVWGNTSGNYSGVTPGTGTFSGNPLYVTAPTNLRLTSNSPCRFASSSGTDIGALPYTADPTSSLVGVLWTNTTLNLAGSPYTATGDVTVAPGVTLTLDAGVTLRFPTNDLMQSNSDLNESELIVRGTLKSNGTAMQPVTIRSTTTGANQWYGIDMRSTSTNNVFNSMIVNDATFALRMAEGTFAIDAFTAIGNAYGVYFERNGAGSITNSLFRGNLVAGVYMYTTNSSTSTVSITNSTLHGNVSYGVYAESATGSAATMNIKNCLITQQQYGVARYTSLGNTTVSVTYSDVWGNTSGNYSGVTAGTGSISTNPQYVMAPTNLKLQSTSFCIDVGTATGAPNKDLEGTTRPLNGDGLNGAEYDMGAYEYATANVCGDGILGAGEACDDGAMNGQYGKCNTMCTGPGPFCGDAMTNGPEQCDDGNGVDTDACRNTCVTAVCGDGVVRAGVEQCDDANMVNTDGCVMGCLVATCGDGYVQTGVEQCDDGNMNNGDMCSNTCKIAGCGDGIVQAGEECDDGNQVNEDTCLNTCKNAACGDGIVRTGVEQCDDGNMVNTDACVMGCMNAACGDGYVRMGFEQCDDGNGANTDACLNTCIPAKCGDGQVQMGLEQCDDGNVNNTDACLNTCVNPSCGDGFVQAGVEQCDDANASNSDACLNQCVNASCGDGFVQAGVEPCDDGNGNNTDSCLVGCAVPSCGDGYVQSGVEACDDANMNDTDACRNNCSLPGCGDGVVGANEACDDGNMDNTDGCLNTCLAPSCGDGFVQAGVEVCDDGNASNTDSCVAGCKNAACGDGFVQDGAEGCDDGNTQSGDGCSDGCATEGQGGAGGGGMAGAGGSGGMGGSGGSVGEGGMAGAGGSNGAGGGDAGEDGSCDCRMAPGSGNGTSALMLALGALGLAASRRRSV